MNVILIKNYAPFGFIGDLIKVKNGFARNFLIPTGVAIAVTKENKKAVLHKQKQIETERKKQKEDAQSQAKRLSELTLHFKLKVAGQGKTFGSITTREIETELAKKGFEIHKRYIILSDLIKSIGKHEAEVKLYSDVTAKVAIEVTADKPLKKEKKVAKKEDDATEDAVEKETTDSI
ncbi:UNVERIFIED_CONTAM: hypothetical protein GTU68_052831 [Idotea baltica]|nr:hypothetical protein [Idotea baltica]